MHFYTCGEDFQFIKGDSHLQETVDLVRQQCTSYDFIFIDDDHSYDGVKCDFDLYKPFLSPRGYIGFHDIDPNHDLKITPADKFINSGKNSITAVKLRLYVQNPIAITPWVVTKNILVALDYGNLSLRPNIFVS